jgi:hypothetical protein
MELGDSILEWASSGCSLCKLFAEIAPTSSSSQGHWGGVPYHLRVFSARRRFVGVKVTEDDATLLGIVRISKSDARTGKGEAWRMDRSLQETGYLCIMDVGGKRQYRVRGICRESFDVDFVKSCLSYCETSHEIACGPILPNPAVPLVFRVIDCGTRNVVLAPDGCEYAALSYVWGSSRPLIELDEGRRTPTIVDCPDVIRDSMETVMKLGMKFLWVDRYCIDQTDVQDKHDQISQMDSIYANARITIIAATKVSETGLPGTGSTLRKNQPSLSIRGLKIASTLPHSRYLVDQSKWVTRGWTYQEGILSKRRLIFTDSQVFFECNGMHCVESLILPVDAMHSKTKARFRTTVPSGAFDWKTPGTDPYRIMSYISAFGKRELTFVEDRINAMRGIFHAFERCWMPVHQFVGVPIVHPVYRTSIAKPYKPVSRTAEQCFLIGLTWRHCKAGNRIPLFPSWSWAGWTGEFLGSLIFSSEWASSPEDINVTLENADGILTCFPSWEILPSLASYEPLDGKSFIHIEADVFPCSIEQSDERPLVSKESKHSQEAIETRQYAKLEIPGLPEGDVIHLDLHPDQTLTGRPEVHGADIRGILIGDLNSNNREVAVVFVKELGGEAERVASGYFFGSMGNPVTDEWRYLPHAELVSWVRKIITRRKIRLG